MNALLRVTSIGLIAGCTGLFAAAPIEAKNRKHGAYDRAAGIRSGTEVSLNVSFSPRERHVIHEYYAPRYRHLPPGLQKKLRRTGQLPPGWQKRYRPFPVVLDRELVALPYGYHRGVIDGHAVVFHPATHVVVDVAAIF
jgi:hypothetical protein